MTTLNINIILLSLCQGPKCLRHTMLDTSQQSFWGFVKFQETVCTASIYIEYLVFSTSTHYALEKHPYHRPRHHLNTVGKVIMFYEDQCGGKQFIVLNLLFVPLYNPSPLYIHEYKYMHYMPAVNSFSKPTSPVRWYLNCIFLNTISINLKETLYHLMITFFGRGPMFN